MDLSENARKILNKVYSWITESNLSNRSRIERQNHNLLMTLEVQRVFLKKKSGICTNSLPTRPLYYHVHKTPLPQDL